MITTLEIHLSYACNLRCNNCSNLCAQAPDEAGIYDLTPKELAAYLDDCLAAGIAWKCLRLHGGEPTLYPQLMEAVDICMSYIEKVNDGGFVELLSNGSNPTVRQACEVKGVHTGVSAKDESTRLSYVTVNDAPIDSGIPYKIGCFQNTECGIALNYAGFFACSPMAAAYRVGLAPSPVKSARHLRDRELNYQMDVYCRLCGFSAIGRDKTRTGAQVTSETWKRALK